MRDFTSAIERRGARYCYPWRMMTRPGDAFFSSTGSARAFSATASKIKRDEGRCFSVRTVAGGVRVTMIETAEVPPMPLRIGSRRVLLDTGKALHILNDLSTEDIGREWINLLEGRDTCLKAAICG